MNYTKTYLSRIRSDGTYDEQFGDGGSIESAESETFHSMPFVNEDGIYMRSTNFGEVGEFCAIPKHYLMRFTHKGLIDTDFAKDGYHVDDKKFCYRNNYSFLSGPEGKVAFLQRRLNEDNTYKHMLGVLNSQGENDPDFNGGRLLHLDFLSEEQPYNNPQMDSDFNLYISTFMYSETFEFERMEFVKLKAEEIWDIPEYATPYEAGAFSFFPNPTTSILNIIYEGPTLEAPVQLEVFDFLGQEILSQMIAIKRSTPFVMNFSGLLSQGTYFIQLTDEQGRVLAKEKFVFVE